MLDLTINHDAKEFILKKGGIITLTKPYSTENCCFHVNYPPEVKLFVPEDITNFHQMTIEGILVYYHRDISAKEKLNISLHSFLGREYLGLNGWKII